MKNEHEFLMNIWLLENQLRHFLYAIGILFNTFHAKEKVEELPLSSLEKIYDSGIIQTSWYIMKAYDL